MENAELQAKISETKDLVKRAMDAHARMKAINKYFRKNGTCRGFHGLSEKKAIALNSNLNAKNNAPFSRKELEDSNYDISKLKDRLMELQDKLSEGVQ